MNKQNTSSTRPAPLFASLADLKRANIAAGNHFFDAGKPGRARLYGGRWVLLTAHLAEHPAAGALWLARPDGDVRPVLIRHASGDPMSGAGLGDVARALGTGGEAVAGAVEALRGSWTGHGAGAGWAELRGVLSERDPHGTAYGLGDLLRGLGFVRVEASDVGLPYSCTWVNDGARAAVSYSEGDVTLRVCSTARAWALELAELSAFYRAPVLARLGFAAPEWDYHATRPVLSGEAEELLLYAENEGHLYERFLSAMRGLVRFYLRGEYDAAQAAKVFERVFVEAAQAWRADPGLVGCEPPRVTAAERRTWAAYQAGHLPARLWDMRRGESVGWRGVEGLLTEELAAQVKRLHG